MRTHEMFDAVRALDEDQWKAVQLFMKSEDPLDHTVAAIYDVPLGLLAALASGRTNIRQCQMARSYL